MIKFQLKLFGKSDRNDFSGHSETAIRDLIKLILMSEVSSQNIPHWSKVSAESILNAGKSGTSQSEAPRILIFLGVFTELEKYKFGEANVNRFSKKASKEDARSFIKRLWKDIYNQKNSEGSNKYLKYMKSPKPTDAQVENILRKLRKIALRLAGQKDNEKEINYKSTNIDKMDLPSLSKLIREAVS